MKIDEMTEQTLVALLSEPLEVPDEGFTQRVLQHLPAQAPVTWDALWPAWLFAVTGGAWLWLKEGIVLPSQGLPVWQALRDCLQQLSTELAGVDLSAAQGQTLWVPVGLVLVFLVTLMQLVED